MQLSKFKIIAAIVLAALTCGISTADDEDIAKVHTKIYKEVSPSVVGLICAGSQKGTGVIIDESGYIITSTNTTGTADEGYVFLKGNKKYPGKIIKTIKEKDLAIIKIEASGLAAIKFGNSDKVETGDIVYCLSDSLESIVTDDQVAISLGSINEIGKLEKVQAKNSQYQGIGFKTTAAIHPYGAGAPIINTRGELIGIATLNVDENNWTNFAIPINEIKQEIENLEDIKIKIGNGKGISKIDDYKEVAKKAAQYVVSITLDREEEPREVTILDEFKDLEDELKILSSQHFKRPDIPASGIIISPDGYIATSYFNVKGKVDNIEVELYDGNSFDAKLVGYDERKDFALLKIDAKDLPTPTKADLSSIKQGKLVVALGTGDKPGKPTIWPGIISAKDRNYGLSLQIDSKINYSNVGGPLLDKSGDLIGITCGVNDEVERGVGQNSGVALALAWDKIDQAVKDIKSGKTAIKWAFLGVKYNEEDTIKGIKITDVIPNTAADEANLRAGDIIIEFDGKKISSTDEFRQAVIARYKGDEVEIKVNRKGKEREFTVTLGTFPKNLR